MIPVVLALVAVAALIALDVVWRRRRRQRLAQVEPVAEVRPEPTTGRRRSDAPAAGPDRHEDPTGPPAAIHMTVTGTHPWAPARIFLSELKADGYETTVELPDLVVVRDENRLPVTVREPAGPPGRLVITATPTVLGATLETLVRSLLEDEFTLGESSGRDVTLIDDHGAEVTLTVTQLSVV